MKFLKSDRLLSERDFSTVLKKAHESVRGSGAIVHSGIYRIYRNPSSSSNRLGLAIGKKVLRNSVDRNRVKRVIREFFRENRILFRGDFLIKLDRRPANFEYTTLTKPLEILRHFQFSEEDRRAAH